MAFIPATPEEVAERLDTKMGIVRETLFSLGEFLSDPDIRGRVCWVPSGSGHKLVIDMKDLPVPDDTDLSSPSTDPHDSSPASENNADTSIPTPPGSPTPSPPAFVPATLTMVTQIVPGQSWLYPDGKWTGPTPFVRRFSDVKLLCTGSAPSHPRLHDDYGTSVENLSTIMDEVRTARNPTLGVICGPDQFIKVHHNLFVVS